MLEFELGLFAVIGAVGAPLLYLLTYALKRVFDWLHRSAPSRERVWAFVVLASVMGFVIGGLLQAAATRLQGCTGIACLALL